MTASDVAETLARAIHNEYQRLAPEHGYRTREASAVPWEQGLVDGGGGS